MCASRKDESFMTCAITQAIYTRGTHIDQVHCILLVVYLLDTSDTQSHTHPLQ